MRRYFDLSIASGRISALITVTHGEIQRERERERDIMKYNANPVTYSEIQFDTVRYDEKQ